VSGTMAITSILFFMVVRYQWGWSKLKAGSFLVFFLMIDLAFFLANLAKIPHGGWVPLCIAGFVFTLMTTWKRGRAILRAILQRGTVPIDMFLADVERRKPVRVKGTAVFMTSDPEGAPVVLLHHLKHNKVLHDQVILLSIITAEVPEVPPEERIEIEALGQGFFRVQASYGFMETPSVPRVMQYCARHGINVKKADVSYYLGRERLLPNLPRRSRDPEIGPMARWRKKLFVLMSQNARGATEFFGIPPNRVVELGTQIEF
jgi:KUP system potassium uptake protein